MHHHNNTKPSKVSDYAPQTRVNQVELRSDLDLRARHNFAYVSFSVLVCLSVLTMSFPAPCADSARPPGMLTCPEVLLSLLKKSGKVFVILFPRVPPPWPATLRAPSFWWCNKNSYESRGMFSTEPIPSPMATPWHHFHQENQAGKSQKLCRCVKP
jgi:hypothetical protein